VLIQFSPEAAPEEQADGGVVEAAVLLTVVVGAVEGAWLLDVVTEVSLSIVVVTSVTPVASFDRLQSTPSTDVFKHHLAVPLVLVCPIDDNRDPAHIRTSCLFKVYVKNTCPSTSDGLETVNDAIKMIGPSCATVAYHDNCRTD